jgi:hypothetical protein
MKTKNKKTFENNTKKFAYRFIESKAGLTVEIWHRNGSIIKEELINF